METDKQKPQKINTEKIATTTTTTTTKLERVLVYLYTIYAFIYA